MEEWFNMRVIWALATTQMPFFCDKNILFMFVQFPQTDIKITENRIWVVTWVSRNMCSWNTTANVFTLVTVKPCEYVSLKTSGKNVLTRKSYDVNDASLENRKIAKKKVDSWKTVGGLPLRSGPLMLIASLLPMTIFLMLILQQTKHGNRTAEQRSDTTQKTYQVDANPKTAKTEKEQKIFF